MGTKSVQREFVVWCLDFRQN